MKRLLFVLSLVIAQALAQESPRGVIRGLVQRAVTTEAVGGADVTVEVALDGGATGPALHLKTDRDGRFEVTAAPPGRYRISVRRDGYFSSSSEGNAEEVVSVSVGETGTGPTFPSCWFRQV